MRHKEIEQENTRLKKLVADRTTDGRPKRILTIIDDDETADNYWIRNLVDTAVRFSADAVFGYVIPVVPPGIPTWMQQREIYFKPMGKTGDLQLFCYTTKCMIKSDKVKKFFSYA